MVICGFPVNFRFIYLFQYLFLEINAQHKMKIEVALSKIQLVWIYKNWTLFLVEFYLFGLHNCCVLMKRFYKSCNVVELLANEFINDKRIGIINADTSC